MDVLSAKFTILKKGFEIKQKEKEKNRGKSKKTLQSKKIGC